MSTNGNYQKIRQFDLWGTRQEKYAWLDEHDVGATKWQVLEPRTGDYLFVPQDIKLFSGYEKFWKITDIFPINSTGIITGRDEFVIDVNKNALLNRIRHFANLNEPTDLIKQVYALKDKPNYRWYVDDARKTVSGISDYENFVKPILYRPFDTRWIFYHRSVVFWPRPEIMQHMLRSNLALLVKRQSKQAFSYAFVSDKITESCVFESAYANNTVLPLYLYENGDKTLLSGLDKRPDLNTEFINDLEHGLGRRPDPEEIFAYIYAVLYAPTYRKKYAEFLQRDFPRVPFTNDKGVFGKLANLGKRLIDLHLLKPESVGLPRTRFEPFLAQGEIIGNEANRVTKRRYTRIQAFVNGRKRNEGAIWINNHQAFIGVEENVWQYQIGGYQVLDKWLKARMGQTLSQEDVHHFQQMIESIRKTIEIQKQVDLVYRTIETTIEQQAAR